MGIACMGSQFFWYLNSFLKDSVLWLKDLFVACKWAMIFESKKKKLKIYLLINNKKRLVVCGDDYCPMVL